MLNSLLHSDGIVPEKGVVCSRSRCQESATVIIEWRNPKIHTADRVKKWPACAEHREYLHEFLKMRNFPTKVVPIEKQDKV